MIGEEDTVVDSGVSKKRMAKQLTGKRKDTLLYSPVRRGNKVEVVEILTKTREHELNELFRKHNQAGETALYVAAEYGDVEIVKEMIKRYDLSQVEIKARNSFDPFHIAAKQGDLGVLKVLAEANSDLAMTVDLLNTTALNTAVTLGHTEVVNFLLELESSLAGIANSNGKTDLHSESGHNSFVVQKNTKRLLNYQHSIPCQNQYLCNW